MREDAAKARIPKARALLNWFADGAMTLLGYEVEKARRSQPSDALGIFSIPGAPTDEGGCARRDALFRAGRRRSADRQGRAQVDRPPPRAARPGRRADPRGGKITGIGVHAGLWTSQALTVPAEEVPVLRRRLEAARQGFRLRSQGPFGKALRHAVASLPRDLLINLSPIRCASW
jgi:glutamate dehydrogenase